VTAFGSASHGLEVGRARLHGAVDRVRARARLNVALSRLAPSEVGLSPRMLLVVQRVVPKVPLWWGSNHGSDVFGDAVRTELERGRREAR